MIPEQIIYFVKHMNALIRKNSYMINLSPSQYYTIQSISIDGSSMTEISNLLGIDNSTLTRNLEKLIQMGLVVKQRSIKDRREYLVLLTATKRK